MTIPDISTEFPSFRKNLKRLKNLQRRAAYLETGEINKATNGVGLLKKSKEMLQKVENALVQSSLDQFQVKPPQIPKAPEAVEPPQFSEESAKIISPKIKQIAEEDRDVSFTVPSIAPEENYASQKFSRLMENYSTGLKNEISNYNRRIQELVSSQKGNWLENSVTEFGRWAAAEQFRTKMQKLGMTGAMEWLAAAIDNLQSGKVNPYEYMETEEPEEFNNEFKSALGEKDYYKEGYINSVRNLYKAFYPQLYKSFIEESDDETGENILIKRALEDLPDIRSVELGKKVLKQSITEQLYKKYGREQTVKLAKQIRNYVDDNYDSLKLNDFRVSKTAEARQKMLEEFEDTDTIQELLKLQGFRGGDTAKLTADSIGPKEQSMVINKFVAELKDNPKFHKYSNGAEVAAARVFGEEFEKHYDAGLVDSYRRRNPYYLNNVLRHVNTLIGLHNDNTPGNIRKIPELRLRGTPGEVKKEDVENIKRFFKMDGRRLYDFLDKTKYPKDSVSYTYLDRLNLMNRGEGLSYLTDNDNHAALFLDNILTENRGKTKEEQKKGKNYFSEGVAFFTDPRADSSRIYVKDILNSPVFMDPQFLSFALFSDGRNPKSSGSFRLLVNEIMPLVTGSYYKGRTGRKERVLMSSEQLALEDYNNNPFIQRLRWASSSPENFKSFLKLFNDAIDDLDAGAERRLDGKKIFGPGMEEFLNNSGERPPLDLKALEMRPIRTKTAFEDTFFRAPDQHVDQMTELEKTEWVSKNPEIGSSVKVFAAPIYKKYFYPFLKLYNEKEDGVDVKSEYATLRDGMLTEMNRRMATTLFEDNNGVPYNFFAEVHDIKDEEMKNGVLESLYILKKFDEEFYSRLLGAKADKKGVRNPDTQPGEVEAERGEEPLTTYLPPEPQPTTQEAEVKEEAPPVAEARPAAIAINVPEETETKPQREGLLRLEDTKKEPQPTTEVPGVTEENVDESGRAKDYDRKSYRERFTGNMFSLSDPNKAPTYIGKKGKAGREKLKSSYGSELKDFPSLRALLGMKSTEIGGALTWNGNVVDWEDATRKEKGVTLFNSLLAFSTKSKPWGLNPVNAKGKVIDKQGLDNYLPREWLENAIDKYVITIDGRSPWEYKDAHSYKKYRKKGLSELDPENPSYTISKFADGKEAFMFSSRGAIPGKTLYRDAVDKVWERKTEAQVPKLKPEDVKFKENQAKKIIDYLKEAVELSGMLDDDKKKNAIAALDGMAEVIGSHSVVEHDKYYKDFLKTIGTYSSLETETSKTLDPYREDVKNKYPAEEYYNKYDENQKIKGMTDHVTGQILPGAKELFLSMYMNEIGSIVGELNENDRMRETRYTNPTAAELKDIAKEMFDRVAPLISDKFEILKSKNPEAWKRYHSIYEKYYPEYQSAVYSVDTERATNALTELKKIPKDIIDFQKWFGPLVDPIRYLHGRRLEDEKSKEIAQKRKEKAEARSKKGKKEEKVPTTVEQAPESPKEPISAKEFDAGKYEKDKAFFEYEADKTIKQYPLSEKEEAHTRSLISDLLNSITAGDVESYGYIKKKLVRLLDDMLERDLFPISDEMMQNRLSANK